MLLGLVGAALGGWMASGEPMTLGHYRRRDRSRSTSGRAAQREETTMVYILMWLLGVPLGLILLLFLLGIGR